MTTSEPGQIGNPWVDRFTGLLDPEELRRRLDIRPSPLLDLGRSAVHLAIDALDWAFENDLFVATPARCEIALDLVRQMHAHALRTYSSSDAYVRGLYADRQKGRFKAIIVLTGPAGSGKTALINRLHAISAPPSVVTVEHDPDTFPLESTLSILVGTQSSVSQVLKSIPIVDVEALDRYTNVDVLLVHIRTLLYQRGISFVSADETQFLTKSDASTLIATLLLHLCHLEVPTVAVLNYSAGHSLLGRHQQQCDRLLKHPYVLHPEANDSPHWRDSVEARIQVAPDAFSFGADAVVEALHTWTFGIDRYLNQLFILAYSNARKANRFVITIADLEAAFKSVQFTSSRETIHELRQIRLKGRSGSKRLDLINPFQSVFEVAEARATAKEESAQARAQARADQILPLAEQKALGDIRKQAAKQPKGDGSSKVTPIRPRQQKTAAGLSAALDAVKGK